MLRKGQLFHKILCSKTNENVVSLQRDFGVNYNVRPELVKYCENVFGIPTNKVQSMMLEYPSLQKMKEEQIEERLAMLKKYSVPPETVFEYPIILKTHALTIDNRMTVLKECGFKNIKLTTLAKYVTMVTKSNLGELQRAHHLDDIDDIWEDLVECFKEWPDLQKKLKKHKKFNRNTTLFDIRQDLLQKFLHLSLNMSKDDFNDLTNTYRRVKHKSLRSISKTVHLVKNVIGLPKEKIAANGFLFYTDPDNIRMLLQEVQDLGGMDIKDAILKNPILLTYDYRKLLKIKDIFQKAEIPPEAQAKCLRLFTLSPETIEQRLEDIKSTFQYKGLAENPRLLHVLYKKNAVSDRMTVLQGKNKRCSSLHKLTSGTKEFDRFAEVSSDRTRGIDTINALYNTFRYSPYTTEDLRSMLSRHPYWTRTSLASTMEVFEFLQREFSLDDIYSNCPLLFYPLEDVTRYTDHLLGKRSVHELNEDSLAELRKEDISKRQILSLTTYFLERDEMFTGKGIWRGQ